MDPGRYVHSDITCKAGTLAICRTSLAMKCTIGFGIRQTGQHGTGGCGHERLPFVSKCPSCACDQPQSGFPRAALQRLLEGGYPIEAYCVTCDQFWAISLAERVTLTERLLSADECDPPSVPTPVMVGFHEH